MLERFVPREIGVGVGDAQFHELGMPLFVETVPENEMGHHGCGE